MPEVRDDATRARAIRLEDRTPVRPALWARRTHKWIAWLVGVQALLWMLSGLYMTAISIDTIHGDHLVHPADTTPLLHSGRLLGADDLVARHPGLTAFRLKRFMGRQVYEVRDAQGVRLVDAESGASVGPLDAALAGRVARSFYRGAAPVETVELLHQAPQEVSTRPLPMWRVSFRDRSETTLYLSATTGELLAKRHDLWRWFDVLWMLHIMDYESRSDVNNRLLQVAAALGLGFSLSGVWLLFYSFRRRVRT